MTEPIRLSEGPIEEAPHPLYLPAADLRRVLADALVAAHVTAGAYDERTLDWLANWDAPMVLTVASLIGRAYAAGVDAGLKLADR